VSGPRPPHLTRRGAVYAVRFRIPADLVARIGVAELRKSLHTYEPAMARQRCLAATVWFERMMETVRSMDDFSRADLEAAAVSYFQKLCQQIDQPRTIPDDYFDQTVAMFSEASMERVEALEDQLVTNQFDEAIRHAAAELIGQAGSSFAALTADQRLVTMQLAARAVRAQQLRYVHALKEPWANFKPNDDLFANDGVPSDRRHGAFTTSPFQAAKAPFGTLHQAGEDYLRRTQVRGVGLSQVTELRRAIVWLEQVLGPDRPLESITKDEMRQFRNDLERLDRRLRGKNARFEDRLTNDPQHQLRSVTTMRYWTSVQAFFAWCHAELSLPSDPTSGLKIMKRKVRRLRRPTRSPRPS